MVILAEIWTSAVLETAVKAKQVRLGGKQAGEKEPAFSSSLSLFHYFFNLAAALREREREKERAVCVCTLGVTYKGSRCPEHAWLFDFGQKRLVGEQSGSASSSSFFFFLFLFENKTLGRVEKKKTAVALFSSAWRAFQVFEYMYRSGATLFGKAWAPLPEFVFKCTPII